MVISSEYATRVIEVPPDDRVLITADVQTPGETLLNSLCAGEINPKATDPACRRDNAHP